MEYFRLLLLCSFLYVALVQMGIYSSTDAPWGSYWKTALPKTPIPKTLQELLHPENWLGGKNVYSGINAMNKKTVIGKDVHGAATIADNRDYGAATIADNRDYSAATIADNRDYGAAPDARFPSYGAAGSEKIQVEPGVTIFFLENDLHFGNKMTLHFPKTTNAAAATLLPRKVANSIPFSKSKLPQILNYFAVKPNSAEAQVIKQTIEECEAPSIKGEYKYCATSLESLVDFTVSRLGKYVQVYSTEVEDETKQEYRIEKGMQGIGDRSVICHKENYVYAVFYCHEFHSSTRAYVVPLVGADGTKAEAVAICHADTSAWNSKHLAFQLLKIKPGTLPICHFLGSGTLVWVPNK